MFRIAKKKDRGQTRNTGTQTGKEQSTGTGTTGGVTETVSTGGRGGGGRLRHGEYTHLLIKTTGKINNNKTTNHKTTEQGEHGV